MYSEFGEFLGWLIMIAYAGTLMNFVVKFVNKKIMANKSASAKVKDIMKLLLKIFVKNHKLFGFATILFILIHLILQTLTFGLNTTGLIAASLMLLQVFMGMYGTAFHKKRNSLWFHLHRIVAVSILLGVAVHLLLPNLASFSSSAKTPTTESIADQNLPAFTLDELATYNGVDSDKAYVAYKDVVYDVTNQEAWSNGKHNGVKAGTDVTDKISESPHGSKVFNNLEVVGTLTK